MQLKVRNQIVATEALIDLGAEGIFIDHRLTKENWICTTPLGYNIIARNVDRTLNQNGTISCYADAQMTIGDTTQPERFLVTNLGSNKVILGLPWLERHNPRNDWCSRLVELMDQLDTKSTRHQAEQVVLQELTVMGPQNTAMRFAQEALKSKTTRTQEEMVPPHYHQYLSVFDKKAAERFPPSRPYDHAITLKPDFVPKQGKVYTMTVKEQQMLNEFIDENEAKGYIRKSNSPQAVPMFFVPKKDGGSRPVQDYRRLNDFTVKNAYPTPLHQDLTDCLQGAKWFTKLDLHSGYNNLQMKDGDQ